MKDWLTIGQLAKKTGLTARALRLYEDKGLLKSHTRGENEYRFYSKVELNQALKIKEFRDLGFSLAEVGELLKTDPKLTLKNLKSGLAKKLKSLRADEQNFAERILKLEKLIAFFNKSRKLSGSQRRTIVEELIRQAQTQIQERGQVIDANIEKRLRKELSEFQKYALDKLIDQLEIIRNVATEMKTTLGSGRGNAASSILLFSKGMNHNLSEKYNLLPDLFYNAKNLYVWIDVDYDKGAEFLSRVLKKTTLDNLRESNISIYQCPFITILDKLESKLGKIDFDAIPDDDKKVLGPFWKNQLSSVFLFEDFEKSVMYPSSNNKFHKKVREMNAFLRSSLSSYKVKGVEDILNLAALKHPGDHKKEMLKAYLENDEVVPESLNLPKSVQEILKPTKGLLIYREDFIRILRLYLSWPVSECNRFSYLPAFKEDKKMIKEYEAKVPAEVRDLLGKHMYSLYLKAHLVCMWWYIKRTAVLTSLHPKEFNEAIKDWNAAHHSSWADLGFIDKDFRPLALNFF